MSPACIGYPLRTAVLGCRWTTSALRLAFVFPMDTRERYHHEQIDEHIGMLPEDIVGPATGFNELGVQIGLVLGTGFSENGSELAVENEWRPFPLVALEAAKVRKAARGEAKIPYLLL